MVLVSTPPRVVFSCPTLGFVIPSLQKSCSTLTINSESSRSSIPTMVWESPLTFANDKIASSFSRHSTSGGDTASSYLGRGSLIVLFPSCVVVILICELSSLMAGSEGSPESLVTSDRLWVYKKVFLGEYIIIELCPNFACKWICSLLFLTWVVLETSSGIR